MQANQSMRHVLNGDAMQPAFARSGIAGAWTIWREAVIDGPVAFDMASAESCAARAQALADLSGIDPQVYADDFAQRERFLAETPDGCELVLWFEADGFCELHLLDLLGRTSARAGLEVSVVHPPVLALQPEQLAGHRKSRVWASTTRPRRDLWRACAVASPSKPPCSAC